MQLLGGLVRRSRQVNHLPVILRWTAGERDGMDILHQWLTGHDPLEFVGQVELNTVFDVFIDRFAVKLTLFQQLGVLFGSGDRHVAEFLPGFLTEESDRGRRYGILLTTVDHRKEMANQRRVQAEYFAPRMSEEQLAPLIAALVGGPAGQFVVNVPNQGQVDNLPRDAVVECMAHVDALGVRPIAVGPSSTATARFRSRALWR